MGDYTNPANNPNWPVAAPPDSFFSSETQSYYANPFKNQEPAGRVVQAGFSPVSLLPAVAGLLARLPGNPLTKAIGGAVGGALGAAGAGLLIKGLGSGGDFGTAGPGLIDLGTPGPGVFGSSIPGLRGDETVVKKWWTGTAMFYMLNSGRIATQRRNGVWRIYRPARHVVVSRNPRIHNLLRADARLTRLVGGLGKVTIRRRLRGGKK